ncbi:uncharacterized protein LY89DRAFT_729914 [Mollisia scopiformis]|uniref:Uncharacterized protein n=1 Tax=Mollisia scopiformis TaxID=149040 RepID=A0A194XLJ4_MOLSC|nr:uncharacterized protein LY89DRAFT_729914 [Mollisia scopiformis]KUJ21115.1 hypothetical protein LY89DRAFT_729914 [Mollisia scopiformis]
MAQPRESGRDTPLATDFEAWYFSQLPANVVTQVSGGFSSTLEASYVNTTAQIVSEHPSGTYPRTRAQENNVDILSSLDPQSVFWPLAIGEKRPGTTRVSEARSEVLEHYVPVVNAQPSGYGNSYFRPDIDTLFVINHSCGLSHFEDVNPVVLGALRHLAMNMEHVERHKPKADCWTTYFNTFSSLESVELIIGPKIYDCLTPSNDPTSHVKSVRYFKKPVSEWPEQVVMLGNNRYMALVTEGYRAFGCRMDMQQHRRGWRVLVKAVQIHAVNNPAWMPPQVDIKGVKLL